ncbi:MAG: pantoate--beta-alanine ligase [Steroidobacteraceae bacterium]
MHRATSIAEVRAAVREWRRGGERVVFVPTMGNLHAGHMSLIEAARAHGERFIASIFVNPMQFGPNEDFAHYPRTPERDAHMLRDAGCDLMFSPDVTEMYPRGAVQSTRLEVPGLSDILCGEFRPGHFQGVATVVCKLLHIVEPDAAVFGEKDFQQLAVIRRLVSDLCMPVHIIAAPTVRDADGLAMSSRNQYLSAAERARAPALHRALAAAAGRLAGGERDYSAIERDGLRTLEAEGFRPDYFAIKRADDLAPPGPDSHHLVVLTAAHLGKARLIDNVQVRV